MVPGAPTAPATTGGPHPTVPLSPRARAGPGRLRL